MTSPDLLAPPVDDARRAELHRWLGDAGAPGDHAFRRAAIATVAGTVATVGQWASVVGLVAAADGAPATGQLPTGPVVTGMAALLGATLVRALAGHLARCRADDGGRAVGHALRATLLRTVLPGRAGTVPPAAPVAAHAVLELVDRVVTYHVRARPARHAAAASGAVTLVAVAVVHWPVAVLLALATPIVPVNLRLAGQATQEAGRRQLAAVRVLSAQLLDRIRGMRTLRTLGAVDRERASVQASCEALNRASAVVLRRAFVAAGVLDAVVTFAVAVAATYVGLTLLGYLRLPGVPSLGFASGLFVLVMAPVYFAPLRAVAAGYHERDEATAAAAELSVLGDVPGRPATVTEPLGGAPRVELVGVTVRHSGAERPVLDRADGTLRAGRLTVLAAPSGAGKSTLLQVLAGLRTPSDGRVLLHEPSGRVQPPHVGRASWIGQRTVLIAGTLADNIRLGDPAASDDLLAGAAADAGLGELLARLPDGLATRIGDHGLGVSAGEARRVALARALLRDAPLWLLDEPTAHLDAVTERELIDTLRRAARDRTVLVATHSPALLAHADTVWRLDRGALLVDRTGTR